MLVAFSRTFFILLIVCTLGMIGFGSARAQRPEPPGLLSYGLYGNIAFTDHTADFRTIPGFPNCCPQFSNGTGRGVDFGVTLRLPIADWLFVYLRAGYSSYGATLSTQEQTTVLDSNGASIAGAFDHSVTASLASIGIEPMIGVSFIPHVTFLAGGRFGYVTTAGFSQKEVIAVPAEFGVFTDTRTRTRNAFNDQPLPNASSTEYDLLGGVRYEVPLNASGTLHALPEVFYSIGLSEITKDLTWKSNAIRAGIAIEYAPRPASNEVKPAEKPSGTSGAE